MANEDIKYSDRAKQVGDNVISNSKKIEKLVLSSIDLFEKFIKDLAKVKKPKEEEKEDK
jgi:hypothetical protein